MERIYYLTKDTSLFSIIYDLRVIKSILNWYAITIPQSEDGMFKEIVKGKYYSMDPSVALRGFKSFSEIRDEVKVLRQDLEDGSAIYQSEGIYLSAIEDSSALKIKVPMTNERTKDVLESMKLVAKAVIEEEFDKKFMELDTNSQMESLSFELQYEEATTYMKDENADVPLLQALADAREISVQEMAHKIISGRKAFKQSITDLLAKMTWLKSQFKNAATIRDLNRLYEDYFGIAMPETQAREEGRVVDFKRVVPVKIGLQF